MWPLFPLTYDPDQAPDITLWVSEQDDRIGTTAFLRDLSDEEHQKLESLTLPKRHAEYATARAMQRAAVAAQANLAPDKLRFTKGAHGKPAHAQVHFNITHCRGLVVCAVSRTGPIGIDAEPLERGPQVIPVMERVFTSYERRQMDQLSALEKLHAAIELWTLKEAVMKAEGLGMTMDPASFEVRPDEETFNLKRLGHPPLSDWDLTLFHLKTSHSIALCHQHGQGPNIKHIAFPTPYALNS